MAPRGHRTAAGGLTRTHSRTSSGGGTSKLGLNLQFTQKDGPPPRIPDKSKKNGHIHHEPAARTAAPYQRTNSSLRVHSRESIQPPLLRRAPTPLTNARANSSKQKVDFTIASPDGDDDEWISSESGAATPNASADSDVEEAKTPVEPSKPSAVTSHINGFTRDRDGLQTPRPDPPALPRIDTARPAQLSAQRTSLMQERLTQADRHDQRHTQLVSPPQPLLPITKARSETHSPPRKSPDLTPVRHSMTRPPSTRSVTSHHDSVPLRPHPLIRGQSYGHGAPFTPKPANLTPLAVVSSDAAQAEISTASSPSSLRAGSPTSMKTASVSPDTSPQSSQASRQLRRTSTSSTRSTSTMPALPSAGQMQLSRSNHDRQRTMSSMSGSSSFAALSSLALRSTPSPPRTPVQITAFFPTVDSHALESIHPLLPPPYLNAHLTILAYRNPIADSFDRVMKAKQQR